MVEKKEPLAVYERHVSKTVYQFFGLLVVLGLNVSIVGSDVSRCLAHGHLVTDWRALPTYAFVLFCDFVLFLPMLLQVKRVLLFDDQMVVETIFWKSRLRWSDIVRFWQPPHSRLAILKTKKILYLLNPRDIGDFDDLVGKVKEKLA